MIDFQIVQAPFQYPGVNIDGSSDGPTVDTHYTLGECRLYLNARTIREAACTGILSPRDVEAIAARYGLLTDSQRADLEETLAAREATIRNLEARVAELAPVEAALARATARYGDDHEDEPIRPTTRSRARAGR